MRHRIRRYGTRRWYRASAGGAVAWPLAGVMLACSVFAGLLAAGLLVLPPTSLDAGATVPAGGGQGAMLATPISGMAATPSGGGYWLTDAAGGVSTFGNAGFYGSMAGQQLAAPVVGIAPTADGNGYWLVAADGGVFAFGDAGFHGSMGGTRLNEPVVGMAEDGSTGGYWLVAADGGVFSFDAPFLGSTGSMVLNAPVVGISPAAGAEGYWLVAADGGVFSFGDAGFYGSAGGLALPAPVVGMASDGATGGYWMVGEGGIVYANHALAQVVVIGDSLTWQAAPSIASALGASFGVEVEDDPGQGLSSTWAQLSLSAAALDGSNNIFVIATAANDAAQVENGDVPLPTYARYLADAVHAAGGRCVVLVGTKYNAPYYFSNTVAAGVNGELASEAAANPNVRVVNWSTTATANPSWFAADGLHFAPGFPSDYTAGMASPEPQTPGEEAYGNAMLSGVDSC